MTDDADAEIAIEVAGFPLAGEFEPATETEALGPGTLLRTVTAHVEQVFTTAGIGVASAAVGQTVCGILVSELL